jgi:predicted nucleic acid-binding protein
MESGGLVRVKLRVYLDTSVISAYHDQRDLERARLTRECWAQFGEYEVATSELTRDELTDVQDDAKRVQFLTLLSEVAVHPITDEMRELAAHYMTVGVFPDKTDDDALHVAAATMLRQDLVLSWNFKHLVNRRRKAWLAQINSVLGLPMPEILAPPEL